MPGTEQAIQAASQRGYEAIVMVIIVLAMLTFFAALGKWFLNQTDRRLTEAMEREQRLGGRIDVLEQFIQDTLMKMVEQVTAAMNGNTRATQTLTDALNARLCILDPSRQDQVVDLLGDRLSERISDLAREGA